MGCSNYIDTSVLGMISRSLLIEKVNENLLGYWVRPNGNPYHSEVPQRTINEDAGSVEGFVNGYWEKGDESGKVMVDVNEVLEGKPNSFHIHNHLSKNGEETITISNFKPDGTVERFSFRKK